MAKPYNYIQIVQDDDWSLVGIIPNGTSSNKIDKLATETSQPINITKTSSTQLVSEISNSSPFKQAFTSIQSDPFTSTHSSNVTNITTSGSIFPVSKDIPHKISEATVINYPNTSRRQPVTNIITYPTPMTPADSIRGHNSQLNLSPKKLNSSSKQNPHVLTGIVNDNVTQLMPLSHNSLDGINLSSLAVAHAKDSLLVGFATS